MAIENQPKADNVEVGMGLAIEAADARDLLPSVLHQLMIPLHLALSPNSILTCLLWKREVPSCLKLSLRGVTCKEPTLVSPPSAHI